MFVSSECLMKTVVIYHKALSKLVFMKISFIIKIIFNSQTFCYLLILSFIVKIIVYRQSYHRCQKIIVCSQNYLLSSKLYFLVEVLGLLKQYQEFEKPQKLKFRQQQILWCESVLTTMTECFLILPLNYIRNFLISFCIVF